MTSTSPIPERPRYRLHCATTDPRGGIVSGGIFETDGEPNQFYEPLNASADLRCVQAGLDPRAWRGQEAAVIAAALNVSDTVDRENAQ